MSIHIDLLKMHMVKFQWHYDSHDSEEHFISSPNVIIIISIMVGAATAKVEETRINQNNPIT